MGKRTCGRCGKTPADGFASVWTKETGTVWYCHDDDGLTCYESASQVPDDLRHAR